MESKSASRGIGFFLLAAIPWVLGMAAATWLGVWITGHDFNRQVKQERRAAEVVGEKVQPKAPVKITLKNSPRNCLQLESARFDGDGLRVYTRRICHSDYAELHWRQVSADGTVVKAGWTNNGFDEMDPGQRSEYQPYDFSLDPRTVEILFSIT